MALAAEKSKREEHNYLGVESNYRLGSYYRLNPTLTADLGALLIGASVCFKFSCSLTIKTIGEEIAE